MSEPVKASVFSMSRERVGDVDLPAEVFSAPRRQHLLHEVVRMQRANRRAGTHSTKTRGAVSGGGSKPWRQKGTGRARAGSSRSPIWVGGATVFGPQPRDYSYRMPASSRREALKSALSAKQREDRLLLLDKLEIPSGKTRDAAAVLRTLAVGSALVVVREPDASIDRAMRNLPAVKVTTPAGLNVYDLLRYETLVVTTDAVSVIGERLAS